MSGRERGKMTGKTRRDESWGEGKLSMGRKGMIERKAKVERNEGEQWLEGRKD